ncbi:MAG: efflux RND transporter permease subunit, partial [Gammaproteobacteria bacterium]|nr:efflux RND transporter permease subunit [Gammaproteobacteria bacterium]
MTTPTNAPEGKAGFNLSKWALEHAALTRYLMIVLMVLGFASYFQLGQDEDPPFTFRAMVVRTYWPGATAQQVAEQITDKLERTLQEAPYSDKIRSYSKPGESQIIFQIKDSSRPGEVANVWYTVRKKIGDIRGTLPAGVQGPFFNDDFGDVYGVIYALESDGFSYAELKTFADDARQQLLRVKDVAKVEQFGVQDEKVYIEVSQKRVAQLGLDFNAVLAQIGSQNAVESAGTIQSPADVLQVRVGGQFTSVEQLRAMPIRGSSGNQIRLGDIADIHRGYVDPPAVKVRHQGKEVIALGVSMAKGGDIIALGKALEETTRDIGRQLPVGVSLAQVQNQPVAVASSVNEFVGVLMEAVGIVLAVSFIALGLHKGGRFGWYVDIRPGLVVAITIPLVLAVTFLAMNYFGIGLHKISLGSLIIALGLLVDDAIIAVEMMVRKMEEGYDKVRAATFAYDVTAKPMLTGTLITAAGFLPIGIAKSVTGEYTFAIFAVTVIALVLSWIVSVYFVPYLGTLLLKVKPHDPNAPPHELFDTAFYNAFRRTVNWCVLHRWLTIGATLLIFALGIVGMGKVQQQFFPDSSRPEIMVDLWFPEGTSFAANEEVTKRVEQRLMKEEGVATVSTWVGSGVPRFYLPLDQVFPQTNVSQMIVLAKDLKVRETLRLKFPALLAQEFPEVRGRVKLLPNGPPVPYPVQFRVIGTEPEQLRVYANEVTEVMRKNPNMRGVNDNWNESVKTIRLQVDQAKARALGVTSQAIAQASRTMFSGTTVGQYRENDLLIDIVLRQSPDEREAISDIGNAYLPTSSGQSIPLTQIARPVFGWEPGVMWRENRNYAITVQGDISEGLQGATVTDQLLPQLRKLEEKWHADGNAAYRIEVAGAVEESSKGSASIVTGVPIMLFLVFTLLMLQLHSFSRSLLVFITGPLGIAGVAG